MNEDSFHLSDDIEGYLRVVREIENEADYQPGGKLYLEATLENLAILLNPYNTVPQLFIDKIRSGELNIEEYAGVYELVFNDGDGWFDLIYGQSQFPDANNLNLQSLLSSEGYNLNAEDFIAMARSDEIHIVEFTKIYELICNHREWFDLILVDYKFANKNKLQVLLKKAGLNPSAFIRLVRKKAISLNDYPQVLELVQNNTMWQILIHGSES